MNKQEFKQKWDAMMASDTDDSITYDDVAKCAVEWGLYKRPYTANINKVTDAVCRAAGTADIIEYDTKQESLAWEIASTVYELGEGRADLVLSYEMVKDLVDYLRDDGFCEDFRRVLETQLRKAHQIAWPGDYH